MPECQISRQWSWPFLVSIKPIPKPGSAGRIRGFKALIKPRRIALGLVFDLAEVDWDTITALVRLA